MDRYSKHSKYELSAILDKRSCLTLASQIELRDEFKRRGDLNEVSILNDLIDSEIEKIKTFKYLKDLGFSVHIEEHAIQVLRTTLAKIWDVVSIIIGLILVGIGVLGLGRIIAEFYNDDEFNLLMFGINILMILLGITGLKMLSGFNRLLDYMNFKLIARPNEIVLHKLSSNLKMEIKEEELSNLRVMNNSEELIMKLGDETIMKADANNFIQEMTIVELFNRIRSL